MERRDGRRWYVCETYDAPESPSSTTYYCSRDDRDNDSYYCSSRDNDDEAPESTGSASASWRWRLSLPRGPPMMGVHRLCYRSARNFIRAESASWRELQ
eukprot:1165987-Prorocentrum_minimum.AAC.2